MPDQSDDLSSLMRAANQGDAAAYDRLLGILAKRLRTVVRRKLARINRGPEDVEDIVQETLLAIHLKRHTWVEGETLEPWVRAIAHYQMIDALRRRGFRDHIDIDDVRDELGVDTEAAANASVDSEKLLARLPARQRDIVVAITLEGRSARDVAEELGATEGAVRTTLHRALKALAKGLRRTET